MADYQKEEKAKFKHEMEIRFLSKVHTATKYDQASEPLPELGVLLVDLAHRLGVELEGSDLLLALVGPELVLPLEPLPLSVELLEAQSVVLLLLLLHQPVDGILGDVAGGVLRIVVVCGSQVLREEGRSAVAIATSLWQVAVPLPSPTSS